MCLGVLVASNTYAKNVHPTGVFAIMPKELKATTLHGPQIRTLLTDEGVPYVQFKVGETLVNFSPDAAAEISLNLLSASYAARAEHALFEQDPKNIKKLLRSIRGGKDKVLSMS